MKEKDWKILTLILALPSSIIGYVALSYFIMELWNNPTDLRYIIVAISIAIYTLFILFIAWLWLIKIPSKKAHKIQKSKKEFKNKILILQDRIENMVIPQLQDKVIKRSELKEFKGEFFKTWLDGCDNGFSTIWCLTSGLISEKIFNNFGNISPTLKEIDEKLYQKVDKLKKGLEDYDIDISMLMKELYDAYIETGKSGWQNVAELHWYKIFNVEKKKRRKYHKAEEKDLLRLPDLEEMRDKINKKADRLIEKCNEIVNWDKKRKKK